MKVNGDRNGFVSNILQIMFFFLSGDKLLSPGNDEDIFCTEWTPFPIKVMFIKVLVSLVSMCFSDGSGASNWAAPSKFSSCYLSPVWVGMNKLWDMLNAKSLRGQRRLQLRVETKRVLFTSSDGMVKQRKIQLYAADAGLHATTSIGLKKSSEKLLGRPNYFFLSVWRWHLCTAPCIIVCFIWKLVYNGCVPVPYRALFIYIYIFFFLHLCIYPKRLTVYSSYTNLYQYVCSLGIEPTTFLHC